MITANILEYNEIPEYLDNYFVIQYDYSLKQKNISMPNNIDICGVRLDTAINVDTGWGG